MFKIDKERIFKVAQDKGIAELSISVVDSKSSTVSYKGLKLERFEGDVKRSVILSGIIKGNKRELQIFPNNNDEIFSSIDILKEVIANNTKEIDQTFVKKGDYRYKQVKENPNLVTSISEKEMLEISELFMSKLANMGVIDKKKIVFSITESKEKEVIYISNGLSVKNQNSSFYSYAMVSGNDKHNPFNTLVKQLILTREDFELSKMINEIKERFSWGKTTKKIESGKYTTVFSGSSIESLITPILSTSLNSQSIIDGYSIFKDKLNVKIFDEKLSISDQMYDEEIGSYINYDNDIVPTELKYLVKNGKINLFYNNLKTAKILNQKPTGNAGGLGIVKMEPGNVSFEKLISTIDNGVFIEDFNGIHAGLNVTTGDFSLEIKGYWIKNGKITHFIKTSMAAGNILEILAQINTIANDIDATSLKKFPSIIPKNKIAYTS